MPNKLHEDIVDACRVRFPYYYTDHIQRIVNRRHQKKKGYAQPDLLSPDGKSAVECEIFSDAKLRKLQNYNRSFQELILVIPMLENINEIWMYGNGKFREFRSV